MPPRVPHLTFPVRVDVTGRLATVQQDTPADIISCLEVAALYKPGDLEADPDFGLPDQTFAQGGPDAGDIADVLERAEPRARILVGVDRDRFDALVHRVTVTV